MPRIRCHYLDCVQNEEGLCSATVIELDPDTGCLTYSQSSHFLGGDDWGEDDDLEETWEDLGFDEEDTDDWLDAVDDDDDFLSAS